MDFPSKNMYDTFKDKIFKELGPLNPEWFQELTAQTFTNAGNVSDQDDLCANQEGNFKTPLVKPPVHSQLVSTPKVFRHCQVVSPETENEQLFTAEQDKETFPWMETQSPYLFRISKEGVQGGKYGGTHHQSPSAFNLLHTPQKSPQLSYSRHISESLGAEINPDMSWTSSLNTPPALASTLLLTKPDEKLCPVNVSEEKNVFFVRTLFPSLSNASRLGVVSQKNNDMTSAHQGGVSPRADRNPESPGSPETSLNPSDCVWKQKLPDAIKDGEIRNTIAGVLDGAEDALSIFFKNSGSALRKVQTEQTKNNQIIPKEGHDSSSVNILTTNTAESSEKAPTAQQTDKLTSPLPLKDGDMGVTQWSPLSLSEIPLSAVDASCNDPAATQVASYSRTPEQPQFNCGRLVRQRIEVPHTGFIKKKRKFIYTVETSKLQVQGEDTPKSRKLESFSGVPDSGQEVNVTQSIRVPDGAENCYFMENDVKTQENLHPTEQAKVQDLDISQLSRDFAQDFSQIPDTTKLGGTAEDTPQDGFSPSACLSAMKRANQKARQANLHHDRDDVSNRRSVPTTKENNIISEDNVGGDQLQSAVTDITRETKSSLVPPSSENNGPRQQRSGYDTHGTKDFPSTNKGTGKTHLVGNLQEVETDAKLLNVVQEGKTASPVKEAQLPLSAKGIVENIDLIPLSGQVSDGVPEKAEVSLPSVIASGFKTASHKDIQISSTNLDRAKRLLEETGGGDTLEDQPIKSSRVPEGEPGLSDGSVKNAACNSQQLPSSSEKPLDHLHLTASQKADVSELCTLLEEADSQFEFTQFRAAKIKHCPENSTDKELDPDFLTGIDFDDSFSSDAEKHLTTPVRNDQMTVVSDEMIGKTSDITSKSTGMLLQNAMKKDHSCAEDASQHISEGRSSIMMAETPNCDTTDHTETSKLENKDPLMDGLGFKTAGGNVVSVSKKCLSKARALFADLEDNLATSEKYPSKLRSGADAKIRHKCSEDNHTRKHFHLNEERGKSTSLDEEVPDNKDGTENLKSVKMEPTVCQSGFQMASGKEIPFSAKAMQKADAFFKDCDAVDANTRMTVRHNECTEPSSGCLHHKTNLQNFKDFPEMRAKFTEEPIRESKIKNAGCAAQHAEVTQPNMEIDSCGFRNTMALRNSPVFGNSSPAPKVPLVTRTAPKPTGSSAVNESSNGSGFSGQEADGPLANQTPVLPPKNGGFQTASGKGVSISSAALRKAKKFFSDCDGAGEKICFKESPSTAPVPALPSRYLATSGQAVASAALKKAKTPFNEFERAEDAFAVKPKPSVTPVGGPIQRNHGFLAASGKPVAVSSEALQKAKALFGDISVSAEIPAVSHTRNDDETQDDAENAMKIHCGFSTAGGAKVYVSQNNMLKAKELLKDFDPSSVSAKEMHEAGTCIKDCDVMDGNDGVSVKLRRNIPPVSEVDHEKKLPSKFIQDQRVTGEKMQTSDDGEIDDRTLKNNTDALRAASAIGNPSLMETACPSWAVSENTGCSSLSDLVSGGGFHTASGKKVSVSDDALTKARSLLNENTTFKATNKQLKQEGEPLPPQRGGFHTASGKGVTVSAAALKQAETLFTGFEGVEDEIAVKPTPSMIPGPVHGNHGFLAASGKPVAVSSEALQKAKALFGDIDVSAEIPPVSDTKISDCKGAPCDTGKMHCGFTTAGGAKVQVTKENLLKARNLLKDLAEVDCYDSGSSSTDPSKVEDTKRTSDSDLQNSSECALNKETCKTGKKPPPGVSHLRDSLGEERSSVLRCEMNPTSSTEVSKVEKPVGSSLLHFQSLNLSGCTETQQRFLAQEALDCTKALLEDENLAGRSLPMTLENIFLHENPKPSDRSAEQAKGKGKRLMEKPDMSGQPPLKRQLLEEFNRTIDRPRGLLPDKSSPNGAMKDRRVFKHSVSLHPNITKPSRNETSFVETGIQTTKLSTSGDSKAVHSKMATFIPPFIKNVKRESCKSTVLSDNIRTSPAFVPPFKKQRSVVSGSPSKPQEEQKLHHVFVPPAKKTPRITDVTANKSKEDEETMNENLMNSPNLPVGRDSKDSAAEASCMEGTSSQGQDTFLSLHNVALARDMQDMRIRKKKRGTIRPLPGRLFLNKTAGVPRIPLKAAGNGKPPGRYSPKQLDSHGVHQQVLKITGETAESFRFRLQQFIKQEAFIDGSGVQLGDGGWLVPSNDGTVGKEEFYRSLCDAPGVDPKLISKEWVYNHYRWIVWKQASMERSFPQTVGGLCLTPEQILLQLKYRYDVEVDHSRRPALRKIMEKDDTAAKTMVLCVCGVVSRGQSPTKHIVSDVKTPGADSTAEKQSAVVWLTDGWYAIKARLDEPLTAMLHKGRLAVGGKLIIHGAQLVGSQDACSPLEAPESLMLKICANSSRPTRWDSKLGFHRDPRPFLLPVSSLYSNGGPVGCVDIIVLRSYPIQWMERKPDGSIVFRSVRAEEKEARRYNVHKQKAMEAIYAKIQAEFEKEENGNNKPQRRRRTISRRDIVSLQDGEELYEAVGDDPAFLEAHLSEQQLEALRSHRQSLIVKKQAELQDRYQRALQDAEDDKGGCPKRDVTPVWRLCVADSTDQPGPVYQMNFWRPPSDLQSSLKEGCRYKVYNLSTSEAKKHGGSTTVQLTGTKKTQFKELQASQEWLAARFHPRVATHFVDLQNPEFQSLCGEVDLAGYVISIIDGQGLSPAFYLADGKLNFVKVRCFSSLAQSGLEDVVRPRVLLALSNLQLRGQSTSPTPVVYAGDLTVVSTNPKEVHLQQSLSQLRNLVQGQENWFQTAEKKLSHLIKCDGLSSISPSLQMQTPASTRDRRPDTKTKVTSQQPARSLGSFTPVGRNPPATNCSVEKDRSSLKRRRALDYLSRIPSPPPLSVLNAAASPCVNKTFIPPRRSGNHSTVKSVQTPANKPVSSLVEDEWVNDEELAMIDTQALLVGDSVDKYETV